MFPRIPHSEKSARTPNGHVGRMGLGGVSLCHLFCLGAGLGDVSHHLALEPGAIVYAGSGGRRQADTVGDLRRLVGRRCTHESADVKRIAGSCRQGTAVYLTRAMVSGMVFLILV